MPVHPPSQIALRHRLREETRSAHDAVEAAFSRLDMNTEEGMGATLRAHSRAVVRVSPDGLLYPELGDEVRRLGDLAKDSLVQFDPRAACDGEGVVSAELHPLAAGYVVLGSRLGAATLSRRLQRQSRQWSEKATAYFTDRASVPVWTQLVEDLEHITDQAEADQIVEDAKTAFGIFQEEAGKSACRVATKVHT